MTYLIAIFLCAVVTVIGVKGSPIFLNGHAFIVVFVGTVLVAALMSPFRTLKNVWDLIVCGIRGYQPMTAHHLKILMNDPNAKVPDQFDLINQAYNLREIGLDDDSFAMAITDQAETIIKRDTAAITALRNLGKYPPALGMIGTVIGMISLFQGLGSDVESVDVGLKLSMAMTATLYGLLLSNLVIAPLADRLESYENEKTADIDLLVKTLISMNERRPKRIIEGMIDAA